MTRELMDVAVALAAVLAEENDALAALDYHRAAGLLGRKQQALADFESAARTAAIQRQTPADAARREVAERLTSQLQELGAENRRLLEQAIYVQRRIVGAVFKAVPKTVTAAPRYGASGVVAAMRRPPAVVLSSRV